MRKLTTPEFINQSMKIHGDKYEYTKSIYTKSIEKIIIICKKHGEFQVTPNKHLGGQGCPVCGSESFTKKRIANRSDVIKHARSVHGDVYDYRLVEERSKRNKVSIICLSHGVFMQSMNNHIKGQGCPDCGKLSRRNSKLKCNFFDECKSIHNDLYDYSDTEYNGMYNTVQPTCKIHGKFTVLATKHKHRKQGCPECSQMVKSKSVYMIETFLIENDIKFHKEYKFTDCRNILPLPFDFFLPDYNMCIEYDGVQHFKPIEFWGGEKGLLEQTHRDQIKNKYCSKNNITLIRIKYTEKNPIEKLYKVLKKWDST